MITKVGRQFVERGDDDSYQVSLKKEGFGLQCHGPNGTMRTPKSVLAEPEQNQQGTAHKPFSSLMLRSTTRGSEGAGCLTSRGPEDLQATKSTHELDVNSMYALVDLNPEANAKKVVGKVEGKLLQEKIQQRKAKLGLASDDDLVSYNSQYAPGFNKLVAKHIAI